MGAGAVISRDTGSSTDPGSRGTGPGRGTGSRAWVLRADVRFVRPVTRRRFIPTSRATGGAWAAGTIIAAGAVIAASTGISLRHHTLPAPADPLQHREGQPQGPGQHHHPVGRQRDRDGPAGFRPVGKAVLVPVQVQVRRAVACHQQVRITQQRGLDGAEQHGQCRKRQQAEQPGDQCLQCAATLLRDRCETMGIDQTVCTGHALDQPGATGQPGQGEEPAGHEQGAEQ